MLRKLKSFLVPYGLKRTVRYFFQRQIHGFDDSETWSLDETVINFVIPRIKRFRKIGVTQAYPSIFETPEDWEAAVDDMIYFLEVYKKYMYNTSIVESDKSIDMQRYHRGKKYLFKYFNRLWW